MTSGTIMAEIAALIGDPGRSNMLGALLSGRALTATELAAAAGVSRFAHVARMLETIMAVSADRDEEPPRSARRIDPALREARTCYDHLAGRLGVSLASALIAKGAIVLTEDAGEVTGHGCDLLRDFGIGLEAGPPTKRPLCRPCLDWSERRPHLGGRLGAALQARMFSLGWVERLAGRAVIVTPAGRHGLLQAFGLDF